MKIIDINCDLGEGGRQDAKLLKWVSSCNIACGGHYGNLETIRRTIATARENKVKIGAHPSYPDQANFGRKPMNMALPALRVSLYNQIQEIREEAQNQGVKLHHVKPHGALYHDLKSEAEKAEMFIDLLLKIDENLVLYVPPESKLKNLAAGRLKTMTEGFADRAYGKNFNLLSRDRAGAVLTNKEEVLSQVVEMINNEKIALEDHSFLEMNFDTICVHGDNANALEILRFLNVELPKNKIQIAFR